MIVRRRPKRSVRRPSGAASPNMPRKCAEMNSPTIAGPIPLSFSTTAVTPITPTIAAWISAAAVIAARAGRRARSSRRLRGSPCSGSAAAPGKYASRLRATSRGSTAMPRTSTIATMAVIGTSSHGAAASLMLNAAAISTRPEPSRGPMMLPIAPAETTRPTPCARCSVG